MILGENYDEYFGLDEYDEYDPCEGYENQKKYWRYRNMNIDDILE